MFAAAACGHWKSLDMDFGPAGLIRYVRDPMAVRRDLALLLAELRIGER